LLEEAFLRSINISLDADEPQRISHFVPTAKCVELVSALLGLGEDRALFVVAPYGSGKSLTATYVLQLTENRPAAKPVLTAIADRLDRVSPEIAQFARARARNRSRRGLALALHGHVPSLSEGIKNAAVSALRRMRMGREARSLVSMSCESPDQLCELLVAVQDKCRRGGLDRIVVLWDEFGKHLESLASEGRTGALIELQYLAEFISRARARMTIGLLLHQGLMQYAGSLTQSARAEWLKVEGRFQTIDYVDTSRQLYSLIGQIVSARGVATRPSGKTLRRAASESKKHGLFEEFAASELVELLGACYPLSPAALYALPRISARVAQNERTLFSYLFEMPAGEVCAPSALYDYFAPLMRSDTSIGGTYRQWLETESAIAKATDVKGADAVLKTVCLLGLGVRGERALANLGLLKFSLNGYSRQPSVERAVDELLSRKLLLHRSHSDEVAVWHGTDLDIRGRLESERIRRRAGFDVAVYLQQEFPAPAWRPHSYNAEFGVRRYFSGRYVPATAIEEELSRLRREGMPQDLDGEILYVVPDDPAALRRAARIAKTASQDLDRIVVAVPNAMVPVFDAALESHCLLRMQSDSELISADPLALEEIKQLNDDAHEHLQRIMDRVLKPSANGPRWFYRGKALRTPSAQQLRKRLSAIMEQVYGKTPKIQNEMIVRKKPSAIVVNARKKLLLGILERSGQEKLGLQGNFPDSSIFRTVLLHTGLYIPDGTSGWRYARPVASEVRDRGLRAVWLRLRRFYSKPAGRPKKFVPLLAELRAPPFGVRAGLLPILIAAGLKAFASAVSLTKRDEYVPDVLPSEIENLCAHPEEYRLWVLALDGTDSAIIDAVLQTFGHDCESGPPESDVIRACFDCLTAWLSRLPHAARTTSRLSQRASHFRDRLFSNRDPVRFLFSGIPEILGDDVASPKRMRRALQTIREELEGIVFGLSRQAEQSVRKALGNGNATEDFGLRELAQSWAACFSDEMTASMGQGLARGLLTRMKTDYETDPQLLDSLSSLLTGRVLTRWDDRATTDFERKLGETVRFVEESALEMQDLVVGERAAQGLAKIAQERILRLSGRLAELVGKDKAVSLLSSARQRLAEQETE